MENTFQC